MEEIKAAIDRVKAHGLGLQGGAPHQVSLGNDLVMVCEHANRPDPVVPTTAIVLDDQINKQLDELEEQVKDRDNKIANLNANIDGILRERDDGRETIARLTKERDEAREDTARLTSRLDEVSNELTELKKVAGAVSPGKSHAEIKADTKKVDHKKK